jgi:hypothetical protein
MRRPAFGTPTARYAWGNARGTIAREASARPYRCEVFSMTTLNEIEAAILRLPDDEFRQLSRWLAEVEQSRWDQEFERDAAAGKLDALAEEALREHQAGRTRKV